MPYSTHTHPSEPRRLRQAAERNLTRAERAMRIAYALVKSGKITQEAPEVLAALEADAMRARGVHHHAQKTLERIMKAQRDGIIDPTPPRDQLFRRPKIYKSQFLVTKDGQQEVDTSIILPSDMEAMKKVMEELP